MDLNGKVKRDTAIDNCSSNQLCEPSNDDAFIHKANKYQTVFNFVKYYFGISIITMPHWFALCGIFGGTIGVIITVTQYLEWDIISISEYLLIEKNIYKLFNSIVFLLIVY